MNKIDILLKLITLIYRESTVNILDENNGLIKSVLSTMREKKVYTGGDNVIVDELLKIIQYMMDNKDKIDKDSLKLELSTIFKEFPNYIKIIEDNLNAEYSTSSTRKSIANLINSLTSYYTDYEIKEIVKRLSFSVHTGNTGDLNLKAYVNGYLKQLEPLVNASSSKDNSIVGEVDFTSEVKTTKVMTNAKSILSSGKKYVTGWKDLNKMTAGGFRKGEMIMINALPHNYKSGLAQSLFVQIPMHNDAIKFQTDPEKIPVIMYISLEDDVEIATTFIYKYLYYNEHNTLPDLDNVTPEEISKYVSQKLTARGWTPIMLRINPSDWSYSKLFSLLLKYKANGYEVLMVILDYLSKMPTTGCTAGAPGSDYLDLYDRVRQYMSANGITFITPHQLSTEAKQLIRNGVPSTEFVKELPGKGYTEFSKRLEQVVDMDLFIHKASIGRNFFLTIQRGRHRTPNKASEEDSYAMLPFVKINRQEAPIREDINDIDGDDKDDFFKSSEDTFTG